jgi:hypothetical protein
VFCRARHERFRLPMAKTMRMVVVCALAANDRGTFFNLGKVGCHMDVKIAVFFDSDQGNPLL